VRKRKFRTFCGGGDCETLPRKERKSKFNPSGKTSGHQTQGRGEFFEKKARSRKVTRILDLEERGEKI